MKENRWFLYVMGGILVLGIAAVIFFCVPKQQYAVMELEGYGTVTFQLDSKNAPETVKQFTELAESGFYDGLTFHRIMKDFMMQGGDPNGDGNGSYSKSVKGEFSENGVNNTRRHVRGTVSLARANDPNSGSCQFFICQVDYPSLDGKYAAFGYVTEGMEIVDEICDSAVPINNNGLIAADEQPVIRSIRIYSGRADRQ